uniref:Uncharacterized protein n=1 Tax=Magallana gigas TaxID=29159 RepID=K1RXD2_MAGGI
MRLRDKFVYGMYATQVTVKANWPLVNNLHSAHRPLSLQHAGYPVTKGVNYIRLSRRESSDTVNSLFDWGKVSFVTSGFNPKIAATAPAPAAELQETALALKSNTFEDLIDEDFSFHNPYLESDAGNSLRFRYSRATGSSGIFENTLKRKVIQIPVDMVVEDLQVPVPKKKPGPDRKLDDFDADLVKRTNHDIQLKGQYVLLRQLSDTLVERGVRLFKSSLGNS